MEFPKKGCLVLTVKLGEIVKIGDAIVTVRRKDGRTKLVIEAPKTTKINRIGRIHDDTGEVEIYDIKGREK
jgi:sRNA-binding carbon storage regulator CsrA